MKSFLELQNLVYKSYAIAQYDTDDTRKLSSAEREELEILIKVEEGSSIFEIDFQGVLEKFAQKAAETMSPELIAITVIGLGVLWVGKASYGAYLDYRKEVRLGEAKTEEQRNILETMKEGKFDAAFLAVGAHIAKRAFIPSGEVSKVVDAVSVLRSMEGEEKPMLGRKVVVYGGGNTAIDVARTAKRMGAEPIIVYRRTRDKMPAHDFEVEEAMQEGVMIKWLSTIKQAGESSITIEKMELDSSGFPQPTGEIETLEADSVVLALGQDVDLGLLNGVPGLEVTDGVVKVDANMMTGHAGIFAGGDMVPAERNITVGVGHGKKAAKNIDAWLRGTTYVAPPKHQLATFEKLNTWYYSDAPKTVRPTLDIIRRQSTFEEVQGGLDESTALFEARRCLSCGNCFECDNCYGVCPDNAVIKLGPGKRFEFNYDYCKGCGLCVAECPCGAINMVPENR